METTYLSVCHHTNHRSSLKLRAILVKMVITVHIRDIGFCSYNLVATNYNNQCEALKNKTTMVCTKTPDSAFISSSYDCSQTKVLFALRGVLVVLGNMQLLVSHYTGQ